ncbi:MAG: hypothetical protein K9M07_06240 [Simkaniaceae bacterium]|nr:hypothetical protein [Simkaniaceae bacterium]
MAIIAGERTYASASMAPIGATHSINGDKAVCEATIRNVATFLLMHYPTSSPSMRTQLNNLKISPLSLEELAFAAKLIGDLPMIHIVPDAANKDPTGGVLITREMEISVNRELSVLGVTGRSISGAQVTGVLAKVKGIAISTKAMTAIVNHSKALVEEKRRAETRSIIVVHSGGNPFGRIIPTEIPTAAPVFAHGKYTRIDPPADSCCSCCTVA